MDRSQASQIEHSPTMHTRGNIPFGVLLQSQGRNGRESALDAPDGRGIYEASILRCSTDAQIPCRSRIRGQCKAGQAASPTNGLGGYLPEAAIVPTSTRTSNLSISFARAANRTPQPSMGNGYNLYSAATRFYLSGSDHGLVQSVCALLGTVSQSRCDFLCHGTSMGFKDCQAGNLQFGSGSPIHFRCIHETSSGASNSNQYGWSWSSTRQHLRRTSVANREIRRGISEGLRERQRCIRGPSNLFPVLQLRTWPQVPRESNAGNDLFQREGTNSLCRETGRNNDRGSTKSPILIKRLSTNFETRPMETDAVVEICKKRRFPQLLGKAFGFPTIPTGPTSVLYYFE